MTSQPSWSEHDIPDLSGKVAIVTGANSGIGLEAAHMLAAQGAEVIMACRDMDKAEAAQAELLERSPQAKLQCQHIDLQNLDSVRAFAEGFQQHMKRLDILCNNAGIMAVPFATTADGFETQIGTNHLAHFALTGLLLPSLSQTPGARVVNIASQAHRIGRMRFADLNSKRSYSPWRAYGQSKLANLLFTLELNKRLHQAKINAISVAAHPGWAATNIQFAGPHQQRWGVSKLASRLVTGVGAQSARQGAYPTVYAATTAEVEGGDYIGPDGWLEIKGSPKKVLPNKAARNGYDARMLWTMSEKLTGVRYLSED